MEHMNIYQFLVDTDKRTQDFIHSDHHLVERCKEYDDLFAEKIQKFRNPSPIYPIVFFVRAHSAYLGTVRLCFSTQLPDPYITMRAIIENALYGFFVIQKPEYWHIWVDKDNDIRGFRKVFRHSEMVRLLKKRDPELGENIERLYDETISRGAHPNIEALKKNSDFGRKEGKHNLLFDYFSGDGDEFQESLELLFEITDEAFKVFDLVYEDLTAF